MIRYKLIEERDQVVDFVMGASITVPDKALSIPEIIAQCVREQKPLPRPVDYDLEAVEQEYHDLVIPEHLSKEDALHLMGLTKAHMAQLEYKLRTAPEVSSGSGNEVPPTPEQGVEEQV